MTTLQVTAQKQLRQLVEQIERLEEEKKALAGDIRDKYLEAKGVGFDPKHVTHPGLGLVSMRERVAALNGRLIIDAVPGRGTRIAVRLPLVSKPSSSPASDKRASLSRART